jgi:hypothetical protein
MRPAAATGLAVFALAAAIAATELLSTSAGAVEGVKVPTEGELYRLRYSDELFSENDLCPVRKIRLGERMPPVLVNGKVIGFC